MAHTEVYNINGSACFVTFSRTIIVCPQCKHEQDVGAVLETKEPARGWWTRRCQNCTLKLGITTDIRGDAVCWDAVKVAKEIAAEPKQPEMTMAELDAFMAALPPYDEAADEACITQLLNDLKNERSERTGNPVYRPDDKSAAGRH
ncbi:hypothetical protein [Hymenobacter siberiensis]|uniref:hypothetical protein n=1 Tax=Hymenobacter siberiensis TaxID=2848396 RepID=UPI001C1E020A|nr:hypothetical protein [Hymenobacter siberiensis]